MIYKDTAAVMAADPSPSIAIIQLARRSIAKEPQRLGEAIGQFHLRAPSEFLGRALRQDNRAPLLACARRTELSRPAGAGITRQRIVELVDAGLDSGPDVESARHGAFERGDVGPHHVGDIDVVASLSAVAIYRHRAALENAPAENRDHAGLTMRILARAVDVRVAKCDVIDPILRAVKKQVLLRRQLGDAVGADRALRMLLVAGEGLLLAVDRAAGGGENHAPQPALAPGLHQ